MIPAFTLFPPEINSALIFGGAGSGPLFIAASAWDGLAADLSGAASSFQSVISELGTGSWRGPSSWSMAAAAAPYVTWLSAAAGQAEAAANQARAAATAFESALTATVVPAAVTANRVSLVTLVATNLLGQNTPLIALNELEYMEMWAQDVGAMVGYHVGATSAASLLPSFSLPPLSLAGLGGLASTAASEVTAALSPVAAPLVTGVDSAVSVVPSAVAGVSTVASEVPLSSLESVAQIGMYPLSMMMSPMMMLVQSATSSSNAAAQAGMGAAAAGLVSADVPKVGAGTMHGVGGMGGLGSAASGLGRANLVGALSVPPSWEGSAPNRMVSTAMSGLAPESAAAMAGAQGTGGGMPMMPMPMGGGAGAGAGGPLGRGGASPNMPQNRPNVIPRVGVG